MYKKQDYKFLIIAVMLFLNLKYVFTFFDNDDMLFILKPVNILFSLFTGHIAEYSSETGYFYDKLNIIIDKSCSGYNFMLLTFVLVYTGILKYISSDRTKYLSLPVVMIIAYIYTIIVDISRIIISYLIQRKMAFHNEWMHEVTGIFVYLFALISIYLLVQYLMKKPDTIKVFWVQNHLPKY